MKSPLTREQAKFILWVGERGLPVTEASAENHATARDLIARGHMFEFWKHQTVRRYTPTRDALAEASLLFDERQEPRQ